MITISEILTKQTAIKYLDEICQDFKIDRQKIIDFDISIKDTWFGTSIPCFDYLDRNLFSCPRLKKPIIFIPKIFKHVDHALYHELGHLIDYSFRPNKYFDNNTWRPPKTNYEYRLYMKEHSRQVEALPLLLAEFYQRKKKLLDYYSSLSEQELIYSYRYGYAKILEARSKTTSWIIKEFKRTLETGHAI